MSNLPEYHSIIADANIAIVNALARGSNQVAKSIMLYNIRQAFITWQMDDIQNAEDIAKELDTYNSSNPKTPMTDYDVIMARYQKLNIEEETDISKLESLMFYYQNKAGFKSIQLTKQESRAFEKFTNRIRR